jgi:hypothetical protein
MAIWYRLQFCFNEISFLCRLWNINCTLSSSATGDEWPSSPVLAIIARIMHLSSNPGSRCIDRIDIENNNDNDNGNYLKRARRSKA